MVKILVKLSPDEAEALESVLALLSQDTGRRLSLDELLHKWRDVVRHVERGYDGSIYEYTNDLSVRDLLERILISAPQSLREKLLVVLHPWEDRFNGATREVSRPVAPGRVQEAFRWWFRIPIRMGGELENDLRSEHVLE